MTSLASGSPKKVRLALLNASKIAASICKSIQSVPEIELVGVAASDEKRAKLFARKHDIPRSYASHAECLADSEVDAVYVSSLNISHTRLSRKALLAGKHVLCEKPLALTARNAEAAFKLAKGKKLILIEGFMYRHHPQIKRLRDVIGTGRIGNLRSIYVNFGFALYDMDQKPLPLVATPKYGGGALHDVGCYGVDFINTLMDGHPPIDIKATARYRNGIDASTTAVLYYASGVTATIECAVDIPSLNTWEVRGTRGSVAALRFDHTGLGDSPFYELNKTSEAEFRHVRASDTFHDQFRNFARSILGYEKPFIDSRESIANARLLEHIRRSLKAEAALL